MYVVAFVAADTGHSRIAEPFANKRIVVGGEGQQRLPALQRLGP